MLTVSQILGRVVCCLSMILLVPAILCASLDDPNWDAFLISSGTSLFLGMSVIVATHRKELPGLSVRQSFMIIVLGWITISVFSTMPFVLHGLSVTDSYFETMSAVTTTGSTVMSRLDDMPPGLLVWRSMLQWIGGIGIIAVAALVLPLLSVGGTQLFKIESSGSSEDQAILTKKMLKTLGIVYLSITVACTMTYAALGMSTFDAINHAMTTVATGGYSTHDASFGYFTDPRLHWAAVVFMILGALPFILYVRMLQGQRRILIDDQQVRGFLFFLAVTILGLATWLTYRQDVGFGQALTLVAFNVTSIVTTTGFSTADYTAWGQGAVGIFLVLMFVGGCSGSTSGSIKIYRFQVLWALLCVHVKRQYAPNRVIPIRYNHRNVGADIQTGILAFLAVFVATIAMVTVLLSLMGLDLVTAYSASVTAVTNVGPGLGDIVGPAGNFQSLPDAAKWVLSAAMLAGRLEVLILLVLFDRDFWGV